MKDLLQDLTVGMRGLIRRPGFTLMAVVTLALGIGTTTSMFSVVNGVLLRPLPYEQPDRIVVVSSTEVDGSQSGWSGANFLDMHERSTVYEALAGYRIHAFSINEEEFPGEHRGLAVTNEFFRIFGINAALGRTLSPDADEPGGDPAVVLSHALWSFLYGEDAAVLGRTLELNGEPYTVVGVMPRGFAYPESAELWFTSRGPVPDPPFDFGAPPEEIRGADYFSALGRLMPDRSVQQAQQEGSLITTQLAEEYPGTNYGEGLLVRSLQDELVGDVRPALLVLFGAVGFVLLIACA
ncbi:ABC transporter permease, partial [Gemmatimonadota bacterium]